MGSRPKVICYVENGSRHYGGGCRCEDFGTYEAIVDVDNGHCPVSVTPSQKRHTELGLDHT